MSIWENSIAVDGSTMFSDDGAMVVTSDGEKDRGANADTWLTTKRAERTKDPETDMLEKISPSQKAQRKRFKGCHLGREMSGVVDRV